MKAIPMMKAPTAVLLIALALGVGLAFHPLFFLITGAIVLLIIGQWTGNEIRKFLIDFRRKETPAH